MDTQKWGNALQGMGAWFSGQGPQYERVQAVNRIAEQKQRRLDQEEARERAKRLTDSMYQLNREYGPQGVMRALQGSPDLWQGTQLEPTAKNYMTLAQRAVESGDNSALEMELAEDYTGFGGKISENNATQFSAKTEFLPGGFAMQADRSGNIRLIGPDGQEVADPQVRAQKVQEAMQIEQEQRRAVAQASAGGTEAGKGTVGRQNEAIQRGVEAARAMPVLRRTMELLSEVETGGWSGVARRLENATGTESADEAELTANLARNVLSQLKDTFGAQFTEKEGQRLERIEAGIGKSTRGNVRLISQALQMNQQKIAAAMRAAKEMGDEYSLAEIDQWTNYRLSDDDEAFGWKPKRQKSQPSRVIDLTGR